MFYRRFLVAVLCSFFASAVARADAEEVPAVDPEALAPLRAMAEALVKAERLSVVVDVAFEVVQDDGEVIEFGSRRAATLQRPDRLRVETRTRDGEQGRLVFDGKRLVLYDVDEGVYAAIDRSGDIDDVIDFAQTRLDTPVQLGELLSEDLIKEVLDDVRVGEVVGVSEIGGVSCDHLAFRNDEVDFQAWIQREGAPLLHRLVIVYREHEGAPRFRASFLAWDLSAETDDASFVFTPPEGVERIPFVVPKRLVVTEEEEG